MYTFSKEEMVIYNRIVDEIYNSNDYIKCFNSFLENIKALVFFEKGDIYIYRYNNNGSIVYDIYISVGYGKELDLYKNYFCGMDDALPLISVSHPVMFRSSDVFIQADREKTDYYKKHLLPSKMHHSIEGNLYVEEHGFIVGIGLHRSNEYEEFSQKELDIMKLVRPHLARVTEAFCISANKVFNNSMIDYDLSGFNEIGIWMWNGKGELIKSSYDKNHFNPENINELNSIIFSLCNTLKNNMENSSNKDECLNQMRSKIMFNNKIYYVGISFKNDGPLNDDIFIAILYDYVYILNVLVESMKTQYSLTDREFEVLTCMIHGMNTQEICDSLFITTPTAKKHITNLYTKLGIEGRHQLLNCIFAE